MDLVSQVRGYQLYISIFQGPHTNPPPLPRDCPLRPHRLVLSSESILYIPLQASPPPSSGTLAPFPNNTSHLTPHFSLLTSSSFSLSSTSLSNPKTFPIAAFTYLPASISSVLKVNQIRIRVRSRCVINYTAPRTKRIRETAHKKVYVLI